jgi:glycosyltransferase involved in cell wall biosynthesis
MRILHLGPFPPPHGGVQTNLVAIRNYVRARGVPCAVMNLDRHRRPDCDDVFYPKTALDVLRLLLTLPYDVVHIHFGGKLTTRLQWLGLICSLVPGKKVVITFHSGGYPSWPEGKATNFWTFRAFVFRRFDALIGVNSEIIELFHRMGVRKERAHLIAPHAINQTSIASELPERMREFFEAHDPVLVTVGLLEPEYDLELQIDALGPLRERFPQAGLVIVGAGSIEQQLRSRINSKKYADHILLFGDTAHEVTLRAIIECSAFLRTTWFDGDSVSVREALHLGAPVIATDNGMRPPGVLLIPAKNSEALIAAIEKVLSQDRGRTTPPVSEQENLEAVLQLYRDLHGQA